jgi:hypothetical protein
MVEAHDRLQRAAAEMNNLRFRTIAGDVDGLSQALSQIPFGDVEDSPVGNKRKRSRGGETPIRMRSSLSIDDMTPAGAGSTRKIKSVDNERREVMTGSNDAENAALVTCGGEQTIPSKRGYSRIQSLDTPLRETPLRARRSRSVETPVVKDTPRIPLSILRNRLNVPIPSGSVTQDEEEGEYVPLKKGVIHGTQFTDLIVDEDGFSQFDV